MLGCGRRQPAPLVLLWDGCAAKPVVHAPVRVAAAVAAAVGLTVAAARATAAGAAALFSCNLYLPSLISSCYLLCL